MKGCSRLFRYRGEQPDLLVTEFVLLLGEKLQHADVHLGQQGDTQIGHQPVFAHKLLILRPWIALEIRNDDRGSGLDHHPRQAMR